MGDRKFNTNDQQARAEAMSIANSNAPQGTPTELIISEAEKIVDYITNGIGEPGRRTELGETVERVIKVRRLRQEQEYSREELRLKKAAVELKAEQDEFVAEHPEADITITPEMRDIAAEAAKDLVGEEAEAAFDASIEEQIRAIREERLAEQKVDPDDSASDDEKSTTCGCEHFPCEHSGVATVKEPDPELDRLLAEEEEIERQHADEAVKASSPAEREAEVEA